MDIGQWISKVFFQINKMLLTICKLMRAIWKKTEWEKTIQRYYQYKKSLVVNSNNQNQKKKQQISIWIKTTTTTNKIGSRLFSVSLSLSIWELGDCMIDSILFFDIFSLFLFCLCKKKNIHSNFRFSLWCLSSIHSK